nr:hypothetical protein [Candidatus Sigynarchaeum springense]
MNTIREDIRDALYHHDLARAAARIYEEILAGPVPPELIPQYEAGHAECMRLAEKWRKEIKDLLRTLRDAA